MAVQEIELKPTIPSSPVLGLWSVFSKNRMAIAGLVMLVMIIIIAIFADAIAPYDPRSYAGIESSDIYNPPSAEHWFGTDDAGKDVFSSFMYGARNSLIVGFFAAFISIFIGGTFGIMAGFFGGRVENILMRFTDLMLVIPDLPLIVVFVALTKPSLWNIILVIGLLGWTTTARIVRSQTLAVKSRKFVLRARAIGAGNWHIIIHHILPLVMPILVVNAILVISLAISLALALSEDDLVDLSAVDGNVFGGVDTETHLAALHTFRAQSPHAVYGRQSDLASLFGKTQRASCRQAAALPARAPARRTSRAGRPLPEPAGGRL